ncbi:MAG: peptidylprolyl isomerase, partial [Patescibacteria group bacterium]
MLKTIILGLGLVALLAAGVYIANRETGPAPDSNQEVRRSENQQSVENKNQDKPPVTENPTAEIETSLGNITVELFPGDAPKTVENFLKLTR